MTVLRALFAVLALSAPGLPNPEFLSEATEFGAQDCLFCHSEAGGGRNWNERGHWLIERKLALSAELVDVAWLSEYSPEAPDGKAAVGDRQDQGSDPNRNNVPATLHRGPFFDPVPDRAALQRWIETRGKYSTAAGEWPQYSGDLAASKYSPLAQITASNVSDLRAAWTWEAFDNHRYVRDAGGDGQSVPRAMYPDGFKSTPLMVAERLYVRTNFSGVAAIDAATGETVWTYDPGTADWGRPGIFGFATRGLGYWRDGADERILLCTGDSYLIALDPATGAPVDSFGDNGRVDLTQGSRRPLARSLVNCSFPPTIVGDVAVVGNQIADGPPGRNARSGGPTWKDNWPVGDVRGYDIRTGKRLWTFHTIPQEGEFGNDTWEGDSWRWTGNNNVWSTMSSDEELGHVYLPVSGPTFNFVGGFREGDNLFSNCVVALDARTGERVWHYQTIRHDIWDWDLPAAPTLVDITVEGRPIKALAQVTKTGFVFVLDRRTGEPVWPIEQRDVPPSEFEQAADSQPFPTKPPPFEMQGVNEDDLIDFTPELRERALEAVRPHRLGPLYEPPSPEGTVQVPGWGGGANWGGAAFDPETAYMYVSSRRLYIVVGLRPVPDPQRRGYEFEHKFFQASVDGLQVVKPPYGTLTAYDLRRGEIAWQAPHGNGPRNHPLLKGLNLPPLGNPNAAGLLVTRTLLFAGDQGARSESSYLRAYHKASGETLWESALPGRHHSATPITYLAGDRQYVVIATGGATEPAKLTAFRIAEK